MQKVFVFQVFLGFILLTACTQEEKNLPGAPATPAAAPMLGKADSMDAADRSCQILLRKVSRDWDAEHSDYETWCDGSSCTYVWRARVDMAENAPSGTVRLMYRLSTGTNWYEVPALQVPSEMPGFTSHAFVISEHVFGPEMAENPPSIEMVAYLQKDDGSRLFDHNVHTGDLENTMLTAENGFQESNFGICQPEIGYIGFDPAWNIFTSGTRRQGGFLQVDYAIERLPECRGTHNGYPFWDIAAHALFKPGNQHVSYSLRGPSGYPSPFTFRIPADAESVELWFENYTGGGDCHTYDSNFGNNYVFDIWPAADHPRCLNVEKDNSRISNGDMRYVYNDPYCLPYDVSAQYDATHCEFYVDDFGIGYEGHYGIPFRWLFAWVNVGSVEGEVLSVGMFTNFRDDVTGERGMRFSIGRPFENNRWRVGFAYEKYVYAGTMTPQIKATVEDFAFFMDVRRPGGEVVRLWQSRGGQNYPLSDVESHIGYSEVIPYGRVSMAGSDAMVFDTKHACGH